MPFPERIAIAVAALACGLSCAATDSSGSGNGPSQASSTSNNAPTVGEAGSPDTSANPTSGAVGDGPTSSDGGSPTGVDASTGGDGASSGTGNGMPSRVAYLLKDATFEGGAAGQQPTQGPTGFDGEGGNNQYSDEQVYGGALSSKMFKFPGVSTFSFGGRFNYSSPLVEGDEVWWRAAAFFPTAEDHNADPYLKFFRIMRLNRGDGTGWGHIDWYINDDGTHRYVYEPPGVRVDTGEVVPAQTLAGQGIFGVAGDAASAVIPGEWAEWQFHVRLHRYPADVDPEGGFVRFYKDGVLIHERSDIPTLLEDPGEPSASYGLFMTYWNGVGNTFPSDGAWYIDDFTVVVNRDLTGALPTIPLEVTTDGYPVIPLAGN